MSNANDMNGAVDFWAEFKKKKEEERYVCFTN